MTTRYLRQARVEIGVSETARLVIEGLRIAFEIRTESQPDSSPSNIKTYNLAQDTERQISKGAALRLYAGYGTDGELPLLHQGEILRAEQERTGLERTTTLALGSPRQTFLTSTIFSRSYQGPVALTEIVKDLAAEMQLSLGYTGDLPDVQVEDYAYIGTASEGLRKLLQPRGVNHYIDNEELYFSTNRTPRPDLPEVLLNERTGLIGSPSRTDNGVRAKMLLTNLIRRDQRVRIESELVTGTFKTSTVTHKGDTWEGEWVTEIEAMGINP